MIFRLILIALLLAIPAHAWGWGAFGVGTMKNVAAGNCDNSRLTTGAYDSGNQDFWSMAAGDGNYQNLTNSDSYTICKVTLNIGNSGTAHVEVWDTGGSAQIGGDSDAKDVTGGGYGDSFSFVWTTNEEPSVTTDYRLIFVEVSDDVKIYVNTDDPYAPSDLNGHAGDDIIVTIYSD